MKQRNGLVSNSSTSSFIVHYRNRWIDKNEKLLNDKEIKLLEKQGFKLCDITHPSHLDSTDYDDKSIWVDNKNDPRASSYAKWITCNQDTEICFLVKNKIPFIASVHYGHMTYIYPRNSKYIYVFCNRGNEVETYHQTSSSKELDTLVESWNKPSITCLKMSVTDFIKNEENLTKELEKI